MGRAERAMILMDPKALAVFDQNGERGCDRIRVLFPGKQRLGRGDRRQSNVVPLPCLFEFDFGSVPRHYRVRRLKGLLTGEQRPAGLDRFSTAGNKCSSVGKRATSGLEASHHVGWRVRHDGAHDLQSGRDVTGAAERGLDFRLLGQTLAQLGARILIGRFIAGVRSIGRGDDVLGLRGRLGPFESAKG